MNRTSGTEHVVVWAALIAALVVVLFPLYWMLNTSLKPGAEVFRSRPVARYLINSLIVSLGATLLSVTLAAFAAYGFTRFHIRGANAFIIFLLFTKMLPETLLIVPYFQLMSALGLVDTYTALILAYSSFALPFSVWMLIGFFRTIPREIDDAAIMDGASRLQAFWRVVLPLARPGLAAAGLL